MATSGWIMMVVVLGGVWGGFVYLLARSVRQGTTEHHSPEG